jgi:hypothetical protein
MDDKHLTHLLGIPTRSYLIYQPTNGWIEANVTGTQLFTTTQHSIIYRAQDVEVLECKDLTSLINVVDGETGYSDEEEDDLRADSDGWATSSVFSYPYNHEEEELELAAERDESSDAHMDRAEEREEIPSSQGSAEFFYC